MSDVIRRVFQPGGQMAAVPKRRTDGYKDEVRGGATRKGHYSHATSSVVRRALTAVVSPQLFLAAVSEEQGLLLLAETCLPLAPTEGKVLKQALLAVLRELFVVQGQGNLVYVIGNSTCPLPCSGRCRFG